MNLCSLCAGYFASTHSVIATHSSTILQDPDKISSMINEKFCRNPMAFIIENTIAGSDSFVRATIGLELRLSPTHRRYNAAQCLDQCMNHTRLISFDFEPWTHRGLRMMAISPRMNKSLYPPLCDQFIDEYKFANDTSITGYYFPYFAPGDVSTMIEKEQKGPSDFYGWVDIPQNNPQYPFAFTGSMNGCHIVVTLSPTSPHSMFRVYHYPSPKDIYDKKISNLTFEKWPEAAGKVVFWYDDTQYAKTFRGIESVDAFNFLFWDGHGWKIYSQCRERIDPTPMSLDEEVVFRISGNSQSEGYLTNRVISKDELYRQRLRWMSLRGLT